MASKFQKLLRSSPVTTLTTTRAFTFHNYKAAQLPAGEALRSKAFDFHGRSWRVKLYPTGYTPATRDFVAVFVKCRTQSFDFHDVEVMVEILDKKGEGTVFDDATAKMTALATGDSEFSKGYVEFARRREVAAACVRDDDSVIVRCTLRIEAEAVAKPLLVLPWRRTTNADDGRGMVVPTTTSRMKGFALDSATGTDVASTSTGTGVPEEVVTGSHTLAISQFSAKKALLVRGECLRSAQFLLGGSNWYIKVYPNGHDSGSKDSVSFFLARGRSSPGQRVQRARGKVR